MRRRGRRSNSNDSTGSRRTLGHADLRTGRGRSSVKWVLIGVGAIAVLVLAAIAALPWLLDTPAVQAHVAQAVTHALGRPVRFASLSITALPLPTVRLRDLQVAEDPAFGPGPFLTVGEGRIRIRLRPLLSGRIELAALTLGAPRIAVVEDAAGRLNVSSLGAPAVSPAPGRTGGGRSPSAAGGAVLLSSVRIVDGSAQDRRMESMRPVLALEKVDVTISQNAPGKALELSGRAIAQPGAVRLTLTGASLTPSSTRVVGEMAVKATVELEAADVAPVGSALLVSPAITGAMKGKLEVAGTPARISITGAMSLDHLTLSEERPTCEPRRRQLVIESVRMPLIASATQLESAPLEAKVARGTVSLQASVALAGGAATLKDISVKGVQLGPVLVDYLCQAYAVTGPLDLAG